MDFEKIISEIKSFIIYFLTGFLLLGNYNFITGDLETEIFIAICLFVIASCSLLNVRR